MMGIFSCNDLMRILLLLNISEIFTVWRESDVSYSASKMESISFHPGSHFDAFVGTGSQRVHRRKDDLEKTILAKYKKLVVG